MTKRFVLMVALALSLLLAPGLANGAQPVVSSARESALGTAALNPTVALTFTVHLPLVLSCYAAITVDPEFAQQGDMSVIGADAAWTGCSVPSAGNVTVAIIDSGVDLTHPDLIANLRSDGYDFAYHDSTPEDGDGHGTNVAGIAAAALNGVGVTGVAPTAQILPVRVLDKTGSGWDTDIADGIVYAADRAQVLNLSLGGPDNSSYIQSAINYATNKGRLVVVSGGNCGGSNYKANGCTVINQPIYPAAYSNVVAVAATDNADQRASFSNQNSYIDIAAPGVSIYNADMNNSYTFLSGTSQAAPHVAGLAALVWGKFPGYTANQVWSRMTSTAKDLGTPGKDNAYGAGRIDVKKALGITALQAVAAAAEIPPSALPVSDQREATIAPGRVIVKFNDQVNALAANQVFTALPGVTVARSVPALNAQVLSVPVGSEWAVIDRLRTQPQVAYAEPDYRMGALR